MKQLTYLLISVLLLSACNQTKDKAKTTDQQVTVTTEIDTNAKEQKFSITDLPLSTADIGDFPFFTAPRGAKYINNVKVKTFDFIVFVTDNDIYEVEGKVYRTSIHKDKKSDTEISNRYLMKSYEDAILAAGGVKVFEGKLKDDRLDKYRELATYAGDDGSIDVTNNEMVTYVIRRNDGNIYIVLEKKDFTGSAIQIVQEEPFQQTIKKVTADNIVKDLTEKGKSVLYINFDVDKADITANGKTVIAEIAAALEKEQSLKVTIEGHTDNTGDATHNKTLSANRAQAVLQQLTIAGIAESRLSAKGFGAERPLVANDSEEHKALNRRVELIRVN